MGGKVYNEYALFIPFIFTKVANSQIVVHYLRQFAKAIHLLQKANQK